jgi:hypothetical protein
VTSVNIIVVYKTAWRIIFELYEHINYFPIVQIYKLFLGISYVFLMSYVHGEQALSAYMSTFLYLQPRLTQFFFFFLANQTSFKNVFLLTAFFIDDPTKEKEKIQYFIFKWQKYKQILITFLIPSRGLSPVTTNRL